MLSWNHRRHGDAANNAGSEVQDLALAMIRARVAAQGGTLRSASHRANAAVANATALSELEPHATGTCTLFEAFHRYVSVASSRAMVLHNTKYLTPLADMANYAPRPHRSDAPRRSAAANHFTLHHALDAVDGSITIRANRPFRPQQHIFEDYGDRARVQPPPLCGCVAGVLPRS